MTSANDFLIKASTLMKEDNKKEAKLIIDQIIQVHPVDNEVYADVVNILLEGQMFSEAKNIFHLFENRSGKKLKADFSLSEIERTERERDIYQHIETKHFKRMTFKERGHFPNYFSFCPIKELDIEKNGIRLKKGSKTYFYRWEDIHDAFVKREKSYKSYGSSGMAFLQKTVVLKTKDKIFRIDVSSSFSDFKHSDILLSELKKYLKIKELSIQKKRMLFEWIIPIVVFVVLLLILKWLGWK